jgi:hypothetical protein
MFDYKLTKTKIKTGLQCHKKLWYDINNRIKPNNHTLHIGNRFGEYIKKFYGDGPDLSGMFGEDIIESTLRAMDDPSVNVIYEAAFLHSDTLIRADVLIRDHEKWQLIEVKSSTALKDDHFKDATIQTFVIKNSGVQLSAIKIAHINKQFIYHGNFVYDDLVVLVNVDEEVANLLPKVQGWIDELIPIAEENAKMPPVKIGSQCKEGKSFCIYLERCESQTHLASVEIPIKILPHVGHSLQKKWFPEGIYDLRELPIEALSNKQHQIIQHCHQENIEWIDKKLVNQINSYDWPRYFIDFETIQQGVPLITNTRPYEAYPFQFSVHKWESHNQVLSLKDSHAFLEFAEEGMDRRFLLSLIEILGTTGPIFSHNSPTEITALKKLVDRKDCIDLRFAIDRVIARTIDTAPLMRQGFYNPIMMGSFSIKDIVKVLPDADVYSNEGESVGDGGSAMIKWLEYTDPKTDQEKKSKIAEGLKKYCAQDTLNLYYLFKYIVTKR